MWRVGPLCSAGGRVQHGGASIVTRVLIVHGPNLGRLGLRQPEIYGTTTLADINAAAEKLAASWGWDAATFQSNSEGGIIDFLEEHAPRADGLLLNPGALTHYGLS